MISLARFVDAVLNLYAILIIVYVLTSWFQQSNVAMEIRRNLAIICEPYIALFRRILPPGATGASGLDFSPFVAILVLQFLVRPAIIFVAVSLQGLLGF